MGPRRVRHIYLNFASSFNTRCRIRLRGGSGQWIRRAVVSVLRRISQHSKSNRKAAEISDEVPRKSDAMGCVEDMLVYLQQ
jgi:hypothetical protein